MMRKILISLLFLGCGGGVIQRANDLPPPPPGAGFVQITCQPTEVEVFVDDQYFGVLAGYAEGVLRLPEGPHRLKLARAGFYSWYGEVLAGPEGTIIETFLVPTP